MTLRQALTAFVTAAVDASPALAARRADAVALIDAMTAGWGDRDPDAQPYGSYLGRDGTPFEPSVRMGATPSPLRWVIEAQPDDAARDADAYWRAALALNDRLAARGIVDLSAPRRLYDVFAGHHRRQAALWFGATLGPTGAAVIKNYFVVSEPWQWREAFARFDLADLADSLEAARPGASSVEFVSVDLTGDDPRLKLYLRHHNADPAAIDAAHAPSPTWRPGDADHVLRTLFDEVPTPKKLGPISTFHVSVAARALTHSSVNAPMEGLHYASAVPRSDAELATRVARLAASHGLGVDPLYPRLLDEVRRDGVAYLHHRYVGFQRHNGQVEVTVYLSRLHQALRHGITVGDTHIPPGRLRRS